MSVAPNRPRWGCLSPRGLGCAFCLAAVAGGCGVLIGAILRSVETDPGVGVVEVYGVMETAEGTLSQIDDLLDDPNTRALVIRVDSPGGSPTAAEEIYNELKRLRQEGTPVVVSMGDTAASAAYFLCLGAERVFANRSTLTGSIGVIMEYPCAVDLLDKIGVAFDTVSTGEFKSMGSYSEALTDRQRAHLQEVADDSLDIFVEILETERRLDPERAKSLADGRLFTGRQAIEAGLVDAIGDLDDAVNYAWSRAGLEGEPRRIYPSEYGTWFVDVLDLIIARCRASSRAMWGMRWMLK